MRISKTNLVAGLLICFALLAVTVGAIEYNSDGKMLLPKDYREWIFLSSGLGMTYTPSSTPNPNPNFDNVFPLILRHINLF